MNASIAKSLDYQSQLAFTKHVVALALSHSTSPIVSTKFSSQSAVFLHIVTQIQADIPIVWVDTGYNTRATIRFSDELVQCLRLKMHVYKPLTSSLQVPPAVDDPAHEKFAFDVKIAPFARAIRELKADTWMSSIRRIQTSHRESLEVFKEADNSVLKVSPMLNWPDEYVEQYLRENNLPIGPSCYDPTKGEPLRECGLHL